MKFGDSRKGRHFCFCLIALAIFCSQLCRRTLVTGNHRHTLPPTLSATCATTPTTRVSVFNCGFFLLFFLSETRCDQMTEFAAANVDELRDSSGRRPRVVRATLKPTMTCEGHAFTQGGWSTHTGTLYCKVRCGNRQNAQQCPAAVHIPLAANAATTALGILHGEHVHRRVCDRDASALTDANASAFSTRATHTTRAAASQNSIDSSTLASACKPSASTSRRSSRAASARTARRTTTKT